MKHKILVIIEDNFNDIELTTTLSCLVKVNSEIIIDYFHPSLKKAKGQYKIANVLDIKNQIEDLNQYVLIFIPGGKGAQSLRKNEKSLEIIKKFNGIVGAICDAPNVLREFQILDQNTSYSSFPSDWAKIYFSKDRNDNYVTNSKGTKHFVTAKCADASMALGYELVSILYGPEGVKLLDLGMKAIK